MELTSITVRNYKGLQNIDLKELPKLLVIAGANGAGKSSFFDVFGLLREAPGGRRRRLHHLSFQTTERYLGCMRRSKESRLP